MKSRKPKYTLLVLPMLFLSAELWAQTETAGNPYFYDKLFTNMLLIIAGIVVLGAIGALTHLLNVMVKIQQIKIYQEQGLEAYTEATRKAPGESFWQKMYKRWTAAVPVEKEKDIMFEHEYDGIRELDNSLPPWWVAMFYITIAFAGVYMVYYHFSDMGMSSIEAYEMEMEKAEEAAKVYLASQVNTVDETTVTVLTNDQDLAMGESIYQTQCAVCHGSLGEGGVGPNMTDEYWIHGGSVKDIFRVIKYGVPEKGMISWQAQLRPQDMQRVSSYILTLQGTNPPNAKEAQGELYQEPEESGDEENPTENALGMNEEGK